MKKSPVYPKHETNDYNGDEYYDPYADFSQFLEEAKRNERKTDFGIISLADTEEDVKRNPHKGEAKKKKKKKKKTWKVFFLLPWWKGEKKSKPNMEQETNFSHVSNTRRGGFASGPVYYSSSGKDTNGRPRRPTSGPLGSLLNPARKADSETPYVCLDQLNMPRCGAQTYGPVYLVT